VSAAPQPTLARALLIPALVALALGALLLRPKGTLEPTVRPPLPAPIVLDELAPPTAAGQAPPTMPAQTKEGLRGLQAQ
jgi:hypothetical protein